MSGDIRPGGIHLLNGLYDAKLDGQPVLALTGMAYHDPISTHTQQDVELDKTFYPKPGQARAVRIELDAMRIGLRSPVEVGLVGDSRRTLEALVPLLRRKTDRSFLERAQAGMEAWRALVKVTLDQAAKFAKSLVRGEPHRETIALTVLGDRVREMV